MACKWNRSWVVSFRSELQINQEKGCMVARAVVRGETISKHKTKTLPGKKIKDSRNLQILYFSIADIFDDWRIT